MGSPAAVAYVVGFFVMLVIMGWHPHERHKPAPTTGAAVSAPLPLPAASVPKP